MGLSVTQLCLRDFRSYQSFRLELDPNLTVIVGPNAVGKTNVVEALQMTTAADSFRKPQWVDTVRWGENEALVELTAEGDGRLLEITLGIGLSGKREYRVNGKVRRKIAEVAGILPCVLFTPEDLRLVKDSADKRRSALDSLGVQLSPSYRALKGEYERLVKQRNAQLKERSMNVDVFETVTDRMIVVGASFMAARLRLFNRINGKMSELYENLSSGEILCSRYIPSWEIPESETVAEEDVALKLQGLSLSLRAEELSRGTTLFGPHRDDVLFEIDGRGARSFSSQGQQRTIALAWKLAEVSVVKEISGQEPLLLLDDVMSELDQKRRNSLALCVGEAAQTVITTTNLGYFDASLIDRAKVVTLP